MKSNRRKFLLTAANLAGSVALPAFGARPHSGYDISLASQDRFDPSIEVIPEAVSFNISVLQRLSSNRPVLAVIKNNGYGLGIEVMAHVMKNMPVVGFAAVKAEACLSLRDAGVVKPILHMGMASDQDFHEMASRDIQLSIYDARMRPLLESISKKINRPVKVHLYIDTGMNRMGIPYYRALPWVEDLAASKAIEIVGSFTELTEDMEFDREQCKRLVGLNVKTKGVMGKLHAASSNGIYHCEDSLLDMVRPGIALYGAYPSDLEGEKQKGELRVAFRLKAKVVRIEQLREGDAVSYGRHYVAKKPVWVATVSVGHADGYLRDAVKGAKVLVNGAVYPVIGAVSASHTILEIGDQPKVKIGDVATLIGPDHQEIHPSHLSAVTGVSVYDILMHLSAKLPKTVV